MVGPAVTPGKHYQDFEIIIERSGDTVYPVRCRAPNGATGHSAFDFPLQGIYLERELVRLEQSLLNSLPRLKMRRVTSDAEKPVLDFGQKLFEALFTGEVHDLYTASLGNLNEENGLRLRLSIIEPQLAALPWEFLYDSRQHGYLCLSANTPLVRHIEMARPLRSLDVKFPLRVLGLVANPSNLDLLDIDIEKQHIEQALATSIEAGLVQLEWLAGSTWRDLQQAMRRGPWHVLHFIGHGGYDDKREEGYLCLTDESGRSFELDASDLAVLLGNHRTLRLVVLNACLGGRASPGMTNDQFTSTAAQLINTDIPAVLAMQYPISDKAAIELARSFYTALVDEVPIEQALADARFAIHLANRSLEWAVPVLYSRASDGVLFRHIPGEAAAEARGAANKSRSEKPKQQAEESAQANRTETISGKRATRFAPGLEFDSKTKQLTLWLAEGVPLEMVYIPEGPFWMGAKTPEAPACNGDEKPAHRVDIYPYWIARYPITRAQMAASQANNFQPRRIPQGREGSLPVVMLSCQTMWEFCGQLNGLLVNKPPFPVHFDLPTEAEWEKAARGTEALFYPYGNSVAPGFVNSAELKLNAPTPVGQFSSQSDSPYGCVDMAGNVWEMTRTLDALHYLNSFISMKWVYPFKHEDGRNAFRSPKGPFIIRGGSYQEPAERCNTVIRDWAYGDQPREDIGFRVVLTPLDQKGRQLKIKSMQQVFDALAAQAQQ